MRIKNPLYITQRLQKIRQTTKTRSCRISCLTALSFCLRDSDDPYGGHPCTFGTHDRDSPEPLRNQSPVFRRDSKSFNGFIQKCAYIISRNQGICNIQIRQIKSIYSRIIYFNSFNITISNSTSLNSNSIL